MMRRLIRAGATKDERLAARALFLVKDSRPILEHTNGSALYVYETAGRFYAMAFWGASARPLFHISFRTDEQRNQKIQEFKTSVEQSVEYRAKRRSEKADWTNPLKVGDILHTSWGYDQTNVEFFAITKVSGRRVWLREIEADSEATGYMSGNCWPAKPIRYVGEELMRMAQPSGTGVRVKITRSADAWPVEGDRKYGYSTYD